MEQKRDLDNLSSQVTFEQSRFKELEQVLTNERRGSHSNEKTISDLEKANRDLKSEAERHKLRVESKCSQLCINQANL